MQPNFNPLPTWAILLLRWGSERDKELLLVEPNASAQMDADKMIFPEIVRLASPHTFCAKSASVCDAAN